jgi:hypothetical protein
MFVFIVDYWFPSLVPKHSGIQCVVGRDEDEVVKLLDELVDDDQRNMYPDYLQRIRAVVSKANRYRLASHLKYPPGVVKSFIC